MVFGSLSSTHEITVLKASGAGLLRLMFPVILCGAVLTGVMFWFNDAVLPDTNHRAKILLWDIKKKKPTFDIEAGQFSTQLEGYTILSRSLDSSRGLLLGVTIYDRTTPQRVNIVSADTGSIRFASDDAHVVVELFHGEIHQRFQEQPGVFRRIRFAKHRIVIPASGFTLQQSSEGVFARGDREMHIHDMQKIVDDARHQRAIAREALDTIVNEHCNYVLGDQHEASISYGAMSESDAVARIDMIRNHTDALVQQAADADKQERQYLVEIYKKYALPFACMVFVFVGCPLGIKTRGGNFGISAAVSLAFYVVYWACLIGGEKLADRQIASPLAMWSANVIIGAFGILLTLHIHYGSLRLAAQSALRSHKR
jgi:lipopolysaccharide export system permease protein